MKNRGRPPKDPRRPVPDWSRRIREARDAAKLSQEALGAKIGGKGQSSVGEYESGDTEPSLATFGAIADALGVSPVWLVFGKPDDGDAISPMPEGYKDDRLFNWALHRVAKLLSEEGLEGDLAYLVRYTGKLVRTSKGAADESEAQELIRAAIEAERSEIRLGIDQIRKNRI